MANSGNILLIITGSIAAYKSLDLIRELQRHQYQVDVILSQGATQFVTPLSVAALTGKPPHETLFDPAAEAAMGHIALARSADAVLIAPCSANFIATLTHGFAPDLAGAVMLALSPDIPIYIAPAMNPNMWHNDVVQQNITQLKQRRNLHFIEPEAGVMACGEEGTGRLASIEQIIANVSAKNATLPLSEKRFVITAGATVEPIDAVRFISNHSSGKQAYAIARALLKLGASVTFVHGALSVEITGHPRLTLLKAQSAEQMHHAARQALPADCFIAAAAVSDWHVANPAQHKIKKQDDTNALNLTLEKTTDILASIAAHEKRPALVIGFAAETDDVIPNARKKRQRKACDWLLANDVSDGAVFGKDATNMYFISSDNEENWQQCSKHDVAEKITQKIIAFFD